MHKIKLSKEEYKILTGYFKTSPLKMVRDRSQIIVMRNRNLKISDIAYSLDKAERTIKRAIKSFSEIGLGSIFSGHENNENASKLTRKQKEEISKVLKQSPTAQGIPKEFWDVPTLKKYIKAEFGTVYESKQSYHFLLKFSDLSFKNPAPFDIRRDEGKIKQRMIEILEEIKPMLKSKEWEVFVSDETRIMYEAITRRAWLKKGKKTVLKVNRKREHQNYIGFLNQKDYKCSIYRLPWQNQEEILKAFKKFLKKYPKKKVCIIWDNAAFHRGGKIKEALKKGGILERVHLIPMPPYAPDKNPIETVWGTVKTKIANIQFESFQKTKQRFESRVRGRKFKYEIGHFVLS